MFIEDIKKGLPSIEYLHQYNDNHAIYKCKIKDLLMAAETQQIINWKYNRPPDDIRSFEIATYIYNKKENLDWLIYAIYENNSLQIIDGIHRFNALQIIKRENKKPIDYLTPNLFGCDNNADWLYEKYLLLSIRSNMTNGQTIDLFQSLNKSNPVPDLYITDQGQQKRNIIENVVNEWIATFRSHFTPSKSPNIPNTNRDRFIEMLDYAYTKYNITNSNSYLLNEKLYELNLFLKRDIPKKVSENAIEKCRKSGCYIFLLRQDQIQDKV